MKRLLVLTAFLGLVALSSAVYAQDTGDEAGDNEKPADTTEQPKTDDSKKEEARPQRPERARGGDRRAYQDLERILRTKDTDGDNKLSSDEFGDAELFKKLDKDEDGNLTLREMLADKDAVMAADEKEQQAVTKEEFGILDRDDSGKLSKEELGKEFGELLEKGDTDKDGSLNLDEFTAVRKAADKPANDGDRRKRRDAMGALDKDGDGKISEEEAPDRLKENFDKLDTDKDGYLSKEEIENARKRLRGGRPGAEKAAPKKDDVKKDDGEKEDESQD